MYLDIHRLYVLVKIKNREAAGLDEIPPRSMED